MEKFQIYDDIKTRTNGDIYIGVVGPVRVGKSTFITQFMQKLVLPNITEKNAKERTIDELPQSADGKTIMTTQPRFVPNEAVQIKVAGADMKVRMIDCVGYLVSGAMGHIEEDKPRLVKTPWSDEELPFEQAAELGTSKVINEHSTIGIVVTTDGSVTELPRSSYIEAEERVVNELKACGKPFVVVLNCKAPNSGDSKKLVSSLNEKYNVPVLPMDVLNMNEIEITNILREALYEFPVIEVKVDIPEWIGVLKPNHYVKKAYIEKIKESVIEVDKLRDVDTIVNHFSDCEYIKNSYMSEVDPKTGIITITLEAPEELFEQVLNEMIDIDISNKANLLSMFQEYKESRAEYEQFKTALKMVKTTGYGVASPTISDMKLDKPEVTKQGTRYGIRLKATAPSIHMIRVDVESSFEPIIGTESQSKELIEHLMKDSKDDPNSIWSSEIFGRSLDQIVQEGIQSKIAMMPENIRYKFQSTMSKVVNKGSNNLIAIVI